MIQRQHEDAPQGLEFYSDNNWYGLTVDDAVPYTTLGINCIAGYDARVLGYGYYINGEISTLKYDPPATYHEGEPGYEMYGPYGAPHAVTQFTCYDFKPGKTYTVTWVAVFEDGIQKISDWTVNMKEASATDAAFIDTEKDNVNVIIMAGQSNMFGASPLTQAALEEYSKKTYHNVYINYRNINFVVDETTGQVDTTRMKTYFSNEGFDMYTPGIGGQGNTHFGPEMVLASYLGSSPEFIGEQWYIIKYAPAGTALNGQWTNEYTVDGKKTTLTDDMLSYVQDVIDKNLSEYDVRIRSFMWMQGESDASFAATASAYAAAEKNLVERVRNTFTGYATRTAAAQRVPGSGISFVNAGIAEYKPGINEWVYSSTVNAGKISNCQWLCSTAANEENPVCQSGPLTGYTFLRDGLYVPSILNPEQKDVIPNSIYMDTHKLLSKLEATDEHNQYAAGDRVDGAHYSTGSMLELGNLFSSGMHFLFNQEGFANIGVKNYTISYDANGGNVAIDSESVEIGKSATLPEATREGFIFLGWYNATSGGTKYGDAGDTYTPEEDTSMYAQWERMSYTITVDDQASNISVSGIKTGDTAYDGDQIKFTIRNDGFNRRTVTVKDSYGNTLYSDRLWGYSSEELTLTMEASDVTVTITQS